MNATDFATIEQQLGVVLPEVFKKFMESFPNNATDELSNDCDSIPCNGEQFAIHQRLGFFNPEGYDYYELQPELRSRRFIEVGGDGCGNYYCMPGDDTESDELWFWEHDPHDGLTKSEHLSLTAYLENGEWELVTVPDPFEEYTGGVYVIRADHPARAPLAPILLEEWVEYVKQQTHLDLDEKQNVPNPFGKEMLVVRRWPGRVKFKLEDDWEYISYIYGSLSFGQNLSSVELRAGRKNRC